VTHLCNCFENYNPFGNSIENLLPFSKKISCIIIGGEWFSNVPFWFDHDKYHVVGIKILNVFFA
jgi:hypothetical protein